MVNKIRRNEIYLANLGHTVGSEERGKRPVLIIQNNLGNRYSPTTIVIPITKRVEKGYHIPTHIKIKPFGKMKYEATIMAELIKIVDKRRLISFMDKLPKKYINLVNNALKIAIDLQERKRYGIYR